MSQQILEKVASILADKMAISPRNITMDTHLIDDLGCDSLDEVEIFMAIENDFGVDILEHSDIVIHTVGDIVEYLEEIL